MKIIIAIAIMFPTLAYGDPLRQVDPSELIKDNSAAVDGVDKPIVQCGCNSNSVDEPIIVVGDGISDEKACHKSEGSKFPINKSRRHDESDGMATILACGIRVLDESYIKQEGQKNVFSLGVVNQNIKQLVDKQNEMVEKHNELLQMVVNLNNNNSSSPSQYKDTFHDPLKYKLTGGSPGSGTVIPVNRYATPEENERWNQQMEEMNRRDRQKRDEYNGRNKGGNH